MDGGGRLLRSVNQPSGAFRARAIAATHSQSQFNAQSLAQFNAQPIALPRFNTLPALRPAKAKSRPAPSKGWLAFIEKQAARWQNGLGIFLTLALIGSVGLYGAVR